MADNVVQFPKSILGFMDPPPGLSLDDRMKHYKYMSDPTLIRGQAAIIHIDGRKFSTFTQGLTKPVDDILMATMQNTALTLCSKIHGCIFAYTQSDEINLVLQDWFNPEATPYFSWRVKKLASTIAADATLIFNNIFSEYVVKMGDAMGEGLLDPDNDELQRYASHMFKGSFAVDPFSLPREEVINYMLWRQYDCKRNIIQAYAQKFVGHKAIHGKNTSEQVDMLLEKGIDIYSQADEILKGSAVYILPNSVVFSGGDDSLQYVLDRNIPWFNTDREFVVDNLTPLDQRDWSTSKWKPLPLPPSIGDPRNTGKIDAAVIDTVEDDANGD